MKKVSRRKFVIDLFTLTTIALITDALWLEKFFIETNEFFLGDAEDDSKNLKVVQVADLHLQKIKLQHKQLAKRINRINPDLIVFTGDSVDRGSKIDLFDEYLDLFDQSIKKVAILGNREYSPGISIEKLKAVYAKHNGELLINDSRIFRFDETTISITGIDDFYSGNANFPLAISKYTPADHHLVLSHCPAHRDIIIAQKGDTPIACVLSGHTHGGQVTIFGYAPYTPQGSGNYVRGWYRDEDPPLYVSKGIGTTAIPVRFGSRAEIAVFNLKRKG